VGIFRGERPKDLSSRPRSGRGQRPVRSYATYGIPGVDDKSLTIKNVTNCKDILQSRKNVLVPGGPAGVSRTHARSAAAQDYCSPSAISASASRGGLRDGVSARGMLARGSLLASVLCQRPRLSAITLTEADAVCARCA
jgi:hypothetical protein